MIKSEKIEFAPSWGNTVLLCPRCGFDHMHQERISVFDRCEDEKSVLLTVCAGGTASTSVADNSSNPSARRQGLAIRFRCEGCSDERNLSDVIELTIAQHKGVTLLEWRFTARPK